MEYDKNYSGGANYAGGALMQTPFSSCVSRVNETRELLLKQLLSLRERLSPVLAYEQPQKNGTITSAPPTAGDSPMEHAFNEHGNGLSELGRVLDDISQRLRL